MIVDRHTEHLQPPLPLLSVLALGLVCQVAQILLLRELLMVFHGSELSIGIILSCWMVWVGVGSRLGGFLAGRFATVWMPLLLTATGVLLILPGTVIAARLLRGFFDVLPGVHLSFLDTVLACVVLMAPVCLLFGLQFVLLSRAWRESGYYSDGAGAEKAYIAEAVGNTLGGLLFTFFLVHVLNAVQAAFLVGIMMLGAAVWFTRNTRAAASPSLPYRFASLMLFIAVLALPALGAVDAWAYRAQWRFFAPEHSLVEMRQSKHGAISVARRQDQYSFYQSGHLAFSTAGADTAITGFEEQPAAHFAHFAMAQHSRPEEVLLIGGGLRGTLREILRHPVEHIDYVELDRELTDAARSYVPLSTLKALDSPRVRLRHTDGRLFVKTAHTQYDMIIVDVPDPTTAVLNRYYTVEFFREVASRLAPGGVFVVGVVSAADLRGAAVVNRNATVYHTLSKVFAHVLPVGDRFLYFFASNDEHQISTQPAVLRARYRDRNIEAEGFSGGHYDILLEQSPMRRVNWVLRNHGRTPQSHLEGPDAGPLFPGSIAEQIETERHLPPANEMFFINSDFRPIGYYYTLVFWSVLSRAGRGEAFTWILRVRRGWIVPLFLVLVATAPLLRLAGTMLTGKINAARTGTARFSVLQWPDTYYAVLLAVFTTGLSTMAMQVALLFAFQSIYGFIYEMVGLIVALFMAGLALGAAITHFLVNDKANLRCLAVVQLLVALIAAMLAVALPLSAAVPSSTVVFILFSTLTFTAGLLNGADFPLAMACSLALTGRAEKSAGVVYSVELLGACIGAFLSGVVIAPVLGIIACCMLACVMNTAAFVVLLWARKPA